MRDTNQLKLCKAFPSLFKMAGKSPQESCMAFGIETGNGWFQIIWDMCEELQSYLGISSHFTESEKEALYFTQIKEKFGTLRIYMSGETHPIEKIISEAEIKSEKTCEVCGDTTTAKLRESGWLRTLCNSCLKVNKTSL